MIAAFRIERTHSGRKAKCPELFPMLIAVHIPGQEKADYRAKEKDCDAKIVYCATKASRKLIAQLFKMELPQKNYCVCEHMGRLVVPQTSIPEPENTAHERTSDPNPHPASLQT